MALPNTGITTTLVGQTLGTSSRDVGTLCTHPNINPLSKWKPIRHPTVTGIEQGHLEFSNYGFNLPYFSTYQEASNSNWEYLKPRGGASNEPFRLGDFRNYEHLAETDLCSGYKEAVAIDVISIPDGIKFGQQLSIAAGSVKSTDFEYIIGDYYFSVIIDDGNFNTVYKSAATTVKNGGNSVTFIKDDFPTIMYNKNLIAHVVLTYNNLNINPSGGSFIPVASFNGYLNRVPFRLNNVLRLSVDADYFLSDLPGTIVSYSGVSELQLYRDHAFVVIVTNNFSSYPFPININTFRFSYTDWFGNPQVDVTASLWGTNPDGGSSFTALPSGDTFYLPAGQTKAFAFKADYFLQGSAPPANGTTVTTPVAVAVNFNKQRVIVANFPSMLYKLNINM